MSGKPCAKSAAWLNRRAPELKRPSTLLCVFVTLLNDRVSESLVFPLLPFLLASFTSSGTTLGCWPAVTPWPNSSPPPHRRLQ